MRLKKQKEIKNIPTNFNQYFSVFVIFQIFLINGFIEAKFISSESQKSLLIYQPYPSLTIDALTLSPGDYIVASKDFIYQTQRYLAVSFYSSGFLIFELNQQLSQPPQLILKHFDNSINQQTSFFTLSHSDAFLWVSYGSGKVVIVNINVLPFKIVNEYSLANNLQVDIVSAFPLNNNLMIFLCKGVIQIYLFNPTSAQLTFLSQQNLNAREAYQIEFALQNQYAFVCTPNKGVQIYKVVFNSQVEVQQLTFNYLCAIKPIYYDILYFSLLQNASQIAIVAQFKGAFIHDLSQFFAQGGTTGQCALITQISESVTEGLGGRMALSNDGRFLFTSFRSVGVKIYDVSDNIFQIVQGISIEGNSNEVTLSNDEEIMFYVNSLSVYLFEKTDPNFNQDQPNLLLNKNYLLSYNSFKEDKILGNLDYSCAYDESDQLLYVSRAQYGTALFSYPSTGLIEEMSFINRTPSYGPTSFTTFLQNGKLAYICQGIFGLNLVDFTDPKNPVILKSHLTLNAPYVQFIALYFLKDYKHAFISNYVNIIVLDSSDPLNLKILSIIDTQVYTLGGVNLTWLIFSSDEKYMYSQVSTYGLVITDISNINKPINIYKYPFQYLVDLRITSDDKYLIIGGGYIGLQILQLENKINPTLLSNIRLLGSILFLRLFPDENYLLATTNENPSISLINISNRSQPFVVQQLSKSSDFGYYDICFSQDNSYAFITGQFALYILFLRNNISIHTQIYLLIPIQGSKDYTRNVMQNGEIMLVGQQVELKFVQIYQSTPLNIRKAYFYDNFELTDLPPWINFNQDTGVLLLQISKDSLSKSSSGQYLQVDTSVVIQADQQISDDSFQNSYLGLSLNDSIYLKQACQQEGYIDKDGYIIQDLNIDNIFQKAYSDQLYFQQWSNPSQIKQLLRVVLSQSTTLYSIFFSIAPSIQFNLGQKSNPLYTLNNSSVSISLSIVHSLDTQPTQNDQSTQQKRNIMFVKASYSGALILLNEQQSQIKIEGTLDSVNSILNQGIQLYIDKSVTSLKSTQIDISVSDGVNYDFNSQNAIQDLAFIKIKSHVKISGPLIQSYFNTKYSDNTISILENLSFSIDNNFCSNLDSDPIVYSAQMSINGILQDIPRDSWLQYSQSERVFSGIPPSSVFAVEYTIYIKGTDGYSSCADSFTFSVQLIPFIFVLQFSIQVLGPLIGLMGLLRFRCFIYNGIYKEKYTYSKEEVAIGDMYIKQIPITGNLYEKAQYLANLFLSAQTKNQIESEISLAKKYGQQSPNNQQLISEQAVQQASPKMDQSVKIKIDQSGKLKTDQSSQLVQSNTIDINCKDFQKNRSLSIYNKVENSPSNYHNKRFMRNLSFAINKASNKTNKIISEQQKVKNCQQVESNSQQNFVQEDGSLNKMCILNEIAQKLQNEKKKSKIIDALDIENISDSKSGLSVAIFSIISTYIVSQDSIGTCLLKGLKQQSILEGYNEVDWYKAFIDISIDFTDLFKNPFPKLEIKKTKINSSIASILNSLTEQIPPQRLTICFALVEEAIVALALGFTTKKPKFNEKSQGETVHVQSNDMQSVRAYQLDQRKGMCARLTRYFNMHHIQKALADNQRLPSWIDTVDLINNTLIIRGNPEAKDVGSYIFKLYTSSGYILRSFEIQVMKKSYDLQRQQANQDNSQLFNSFNKLMKPISTQEKTKLAQLYSQSNEISMFKSNLQATDNFNQNENSLRNLNFSKHNQQKSDVQNTIGENTLMTQDYQFNTQQQSPFNEQYFNSELQKKLQTNIQKGYLNDFYGDVALGCDEESDVQCE